MCCLLGYYTILSLLDASHFDEAIAKQTSVSPSAISKLGFKKYSTLPKAIGGYPSKLSPTNIHHVQDFITSDRAENAVQVIKALSNIINEPLSASIVHLHLKKSGMRAVVKSKHPILSARHCKAHLNFAYIHKNWTVKD